jgi:hypothetical protein
MSAKDDVFVSTLTQCVSDAFHERMNDQIFKLRIDFHENEL